MDKDTRKRIQQWVYDLSTFELECTKELTDRNNVQAWRLWERIDEIMIYLEGV